MNLSDPLYRQNANQTESTQTSLDPRKHYLKDMDSNKTLNGDLGSNAQSGVYGPILIVDVTHSVRSARDTFKVGDLILVVGELQKKANTPPKTEDKILNARILKNVNGIDMNLYQNSSIMRREYIQRRFGTNV